MLYSDQAEIVFQECPGEIALAYSCYGCPLACPGCHSPQLQKPGGIALTAERLLADIERYRNLISCVVFFGGEWSPQTLAQRCALVQQQGLKTCLYTGLEHISRHLRPHLDFAKTGPWREECGPLGSKQGNQRYWRLHQGEIRDDLTALFSEV